MRHPRMKSFSVILCVFTLTCTGIVGCAERASGSPTPTSIASCGTGICGTDESSASCPLDCAARGFSGKIYTTYVNSTGVGDIAMMIAEPKAARYPEGAGVVVVASPVFSQTGGFQTTPDFTSIGLIQVSYLWPGQTDALTVMRSGGEFDYGGDKSVQVLQDVIRFAAGQIPDKDGKYLSSIITTTALTTEVGLYAFSDAGIAAVNVLSIDGDNLTNVQYFIGRENPTVDTLTCLEAGYQNDSIQPELNPFYSYPTSYATDQIALNYANVHWDPNYSDPVSRAAGRPYLDLDGSGTLSSADYIFSWRVPVMFGKRHYSVALTQALLDNGALTVSTWPADLATPAEAAHDWPFRQSPGRYSLLRTKMPQLKVMLVFGQKDTYQAAPDKPHIHQAFQGFRFEAGLWVRLNPDRAYVKAVIPSAGESFPDNPANTEPEDWAQIGAYAYPDQDNSAQLVPLAAIAEMADRTHFNRWDENLGQTLYIYFPNTPQP